MTFNGVAATVSSWSAASIVAVVPTGAATGNVVVTVGGVTSNAVSFTVAVPPSITSLTPASGAVGAPVTIAGANFGATQGTSTVTFNGVAATVNSWSAGSIVAVVPTGAATGNVVVAVGGVASNAVSFTVAAPPSITGLTPASGAVGAPVTIAGANFGATQGTSTVTFNSVAATVNSWGAASIVALVPAGAATGNVVVTVGGVASTGVLFTVVVPDLTITKTHNGIFTQGQTGAYAITVTNSGPAPTTGAVTVTDTLPTGLTVNAIYGTGWSCSISPVTCTRSDALAPGSSYAPITLTVNVAANAPSSVTNRADVSGGGETNATNDRADDPTAVVALPTLTVVNPSSGTQGTSVAVSLTGTNFVAGATVAVGNPGVTVSNVSVMSSAQILANFTIAANASAGAANVTVTTAAGTSGAVSFTVVAANAPTITNLSPMSGPVGTAVTITGTNFGSVVPPFPTVTFNGINADSVSWGGSTNLVAWVPSGATTGNVVVTLNGVASNGVQLYGDLTCDYQCVAKLGLGGTAGNHFRCGIRFDARDRIGVAGQHVCLGGELDEHSGGGHRAVHRHLRDSSGATGRNLVQRFSLPRKHRDDYECHADERCGRCRGDHLGFRVRFIAGRWKNWLGTAYGVVQSWTDTQIVATVAPGATVWQPGQPVRRACRPDSGRRNAISLRLAARQPGRQRPEARATALRRQLQEAVPARFRCCSTGCGATPPIHGESAARRDYQPHIGRSGSQRHDHRHWLRRFMQGSGVVWLGSTVGHWCRVGATRRWWPVAPSSLTGIVRIQQNGAWSNALTFTEPGNTTLLVPNLINLAVGDTATVQASNLAGQPLTGLTWTTSNPTVVSLSTDDPPVLTGVAAGHATILAGTASIDVTVTDVSLTGTLPTGTVIWSNPGDGSGVDAIVPAVPSPTGVADVFAFNYDGTVQAIRSDGTTAWTADVSQAGIYEAGGIVPDFLGGLVAKEGNSICQIRWPYRAGPNRVHGCLRNGPRRSGPTSRWHHLHRCL